MKWAKRITVIICVLTMVAFVGYTSVKAEPTEQDNSLEGYKLQGLGRLQYDRDGSGEFGDNPEDFIYDADDLMIFDNLVRNGKTAISSVINSYQTGDVLTLDTFANLSSAIDSLSTFPSGKYYYDSTTGTDDASTLVRYIKENNTYYLCDQYGNKLSDEAQIVTESNLVEYTGITQENLSAGSAGMVNKTFILGNGSDNITYRNLGYASGVDDTITQNAVKITRHEHINNCKCKGSIVNYDSREYSGEAHHGCIYYYRCSMCSYSCSYTTRTDHYWREDGSQFFGNTYIVNGTYPVPTVCPNYSCGKEAGISIDQLTINGIIYNITDGTIIEE